MKARCESTSKALAFQRYDKYQPPQVAPHPCDWWGWGSIPHGANGRVVDLVLRAISNVIYEVVLGDVSAVPV